METAKDIIDSIVDSQPEGKELLNIIRVSMKDVGDQYADCAVLRRIVAAKYDINVLNREGYTLQQILNTSSGLLHDEAEKFVIKHLQEYIRTRTKK